MATIPSGTGNDFLDLNTLVLGPGETAHSANGQAGNDTIVGHNTVASLMTGGTGNDSIRGGSNNDILIGDEAAGVSVGADILVAGAGNDLLFGGAGNDTLIGEGGNDLLRGGRNNDDYRVALGFDGNDTINDDASASSTLSGFGGGVDILRIVNSSFVNLVVARSGNNLLVTDQFDLLDGASDFVTIQNFFLGGNNVIEQLAGNDGVAHDISFVVGASLTPGVWYSFT